MRPGKNDVNQALSLRLVEALPEWQRSELSLRRRVVHWISVLEWLRIEFAPPVVRKLPGQRLGCKLAIPASSLRSNKLEMSQLVEQNVVEQEAANRPRRPL